ncbi:MAG: hypothetical protein ABI585_00685 [Betaproteobacteria bacterium]
MTAVVTRRSVASMLPEWVSRLSSASGPAWIAGWSNADIVVAALVVFAVAFSLAAAWTADWLSDVAFLSLVAGALVVAWPAMIVLTMASLALAAGISFLHARLAPDRSARISADAERRAASAVEEFARGAGMSEDEWTRLRAKVEEGRQPG